MTATPSIEQFINADFNIMPGWGRDDNPTITVENAVAVEPFYYEVSVETFSTLHQDALCLDEVEDDYITKSSDVEIELDESYNIML